jgi:hypothetical protein
MDDLICTPDRRRITNDRITKDDLGTQEILARCPKSPYAHLKKYEMKLTISSR